MQYFSKILGKIERVLFLPEPILNAFNQAQNSIPISVQQAEKALLFLPFLSFPLLSLDAPMLTMVFYFLQLLLSPKKNHIYFFIEPALLLSFGFTYPSLSPFAFLFFVSGWILMHLNFAIFYHHPVHRFFWITLIVFFPSSVVFLAPLLSGICLAIGFHKRFFVWGENKAE